VPAFPAPASPGPTAANGPEVADVLYQRRPWAAVAALVALALCSFAFVTTEDLPVGLLQVISANLKASVSSVGLLVSVYAGTVVIISAPLAHLTKHVPHRRLLCVLLGVFVLTTLASAAAGNYWVLLGTRVLTATAQGLFWSVAVVTAVGLFPPGARAKAVAGVTAGSSLAVVGGVPAGTWLGQQGGWRLPFLVLSGFGLVGLLAVATLLPTAKPSESHASVGSQPDLRHYRLLMVTTVLVVTGALTAYTYISPFLTRVARFPAHAIAPLLVLTGVSGTLGVIVASLLFDRRRRLATLGPMAVLTTALLALYLVGTTAAAAAALEALAGFGMGAFVISNQNRVMVVAPGRTEMASAWASVSFNLGIGGGSLIGSLVIATLGARSTALFGALLVASALGFLLSQQLRRGGRRSGPDLGRHGPGLPHA
jgi:predicted MFS family arabinose efflux permease